MSTEGTGVVAVGAGVVLGGAAILAAGAVIGAGVLIARGVMWCGRKMEENAERASQEWIKLEQAAYADSRASVQDMPMYIVGQAERIAAATAHLIVPAAPHAPANLAAQKQLDDALARARAALANAHDTAQTQADAERDLLAYRLKSEIETSRGLLPAGVIARAEQVLQGSEREMREALNALQAAWQKMADARVMDTHQERQTRESLRSSSAQLFAIDALLRNAGGTQDSPYSKQRLDIESRIERAQALVATDLAQASALAEDARRATSELMHAVSSETLSEWDRVHREVVSVQGTLDTLARMLQEATAVKLVESERVRDLKQRIASAQREAMQLVQSSAIPVQAQLVALNGNVARLKTEVFRVVKTRQQKQIAETVATTLGELGFSADAGAQPVVQESGELMRVVATRSGNTPGFRRDDKVVSFDVSRDGNLTYDFSGYEGDTCLSEAKEVFAALKAKGIYVLDQEALESLQRLPAERITAETLQRTRYDPQPVRNKTQAELAERLQEVLAQMQFSNVQQSVIGGCIDIEAFNGNTGYHVVLPPDGSTEVFRDHVDISGNQEDVLVRELSRAVEETPRKAGPERKAKSGETWQQDMDAFRKQMLDH